MKTTHTLRALGAAALLLALTPASRASLFSYEVTLNVASLDSEANGPYSLDLQLVPGQDNVSNMVTIRNFVVTGGSFTGSPSYTNGGESGSTASSVILTMSDPADNEFAQEFTSTTTQIQFLVQESNNQETGGTTPAPDQFNIAILDTNLNNIATNAPSGNVLVTDAMVGSQQLNQVGTYASTGSDGNGGVTAAVTVPEPGSAALLALGVAGLCFRRRARRG